MNFVPRILHTSTIERYSESFHYTILTMLRGDDFVNGYRETTVAQQKQLGKDIAQFLDDLQKITGTHYDI